MSLKKFPVFTIVNIFNILLFSAALVPVLTRWDGFLKDCPSSSFIIDAVYGACGVMIAIGLVGILSTITRIRIGIYFYKFLLFLALIVAGAFVTLTLLMKAGAANFVLRLGWSMAPDNEIRQFQSQFGCAGWQSQCIPGYKIDGCPSCTFPNYNSSATPSTTPALLPTCSDIFQNFFDGQFKWIIIGAGSFIGWVIILNVTAYCAGQRFTLVSIDEDEEYVIERAERRRELHRLLEEEEQRSLQQLNTPVNSAATKSPAKGTQYGSNLTPSHHIL